MLAAADGFTESLISISFLKLKLSVRNMQQEERGWYNSDTSEKFWLLTWHFKQPISQHTHRPRGMCNLFTEELAATTHTNSCQIGNVPATWILKGSLSNTNTWRKKGSLCENEQLRKIRRQSFSPWKGLMSVSLRQRLPNSFPKEEHTRLTRFSPPTVPTTNLR